MRILCFWKLTIACLPSACLLLAGCKPTPTPPREQPRSREETRERRRGEESSFGNERESYGSRHDEAERGGRGRSRRGDVTDTPGHFDFYLLNLSWSPEFCSTHPDKPECTAHPGFVLHGLWPQNHDGTYPEHCSDAAAPADLSRYRDLHSDAGLLRHEWSTHGTCSGLAADAFFEQARRAVREVHIPPDLAGLDHETAMPPQAILDAFANANPSLPRTSLALSCGNNYLTAVEVCLTRDLRAEPCGELRTCRANSVRVVPPGARGSR